MRLRFVRDRQNVPPAQATEQGSAKLEVAWQALGANSDAGAITATSTSFSRSESLSVGWPPCATPEELKTA